MAFTELLARSSFSFLRGASSPEEVVERVAELGQSSVGLCDRNGLYGCVRGHKKAKELGLRLHVGAELPIAALNERVERCDNPASGTQVSDGNPAVVSVLARSQAGYANLCRLLTQAHGGLPKGQCWLEPGFVERCHNELTLVVPVQLGSSGRRVREWLRFLAECFGSRGYVAVMRRFDGSDVARLATAKSWSRISGFSVVATAWPAFHVPERKPLTDILHCIRTGTTLDSAGTALCANAEASLRAEAELKRWFAPHRDWVERTAEVGSELAFTLDELHYEFPCTLDPGETADERLRRLTLVGTARRYPGGMSERVSKQIEKELTLIAELKVAPYFLCTHEVVEIARERRILCQGRGSAANSAVCFALGITAVDPARSNLLFERFLSAERNEPPDIDIDFEHERREEVIQEIYRRYGRQRAAMVSEVICYRGKSALREVGKAFGLSLAQVDQLSQVMTHWDSSAVVEKRLAEYGFDPRDARVSQTLRWAGVLEGFPRHLSIHVGGFVLSKTDLCEVAPVEPAAMADRTVVPWDKDDIDDLGFFKVDVLGLGMLTAVRKALALIFECGALRAGQLRAERPRAGRLRAERPRADRLHDRRAPERQLHERQLHERQLPNSVEEETVESPETFDPLDVVARIPPEDPAVYARVSEADTVGVFQIESRAQMAMLPRLRPQRFYDLVVEVAIVRPGPIQGGMVHPYLKRRNGEDVVTVPHPDLWPILERTLGVPLFQEQVMQLSIVGAGYTGGQADQLRRDMAAWKKTGRLLRHRERLLRGFEAKGISQEFGEALFEQIKGFGEYGFPESHAASFALIVYVSAWLKVHFPAHFVCAILNAQPMGFYSPASLIRDAREHGVEVRAVSIAHSDWDSTLEPSSERCRIQSQQPEARRALRMGFRLIRGLGQGAAERISAARNDGPFTSLDDLMLRAALIKNDVEALAEAGALESVVQGRRQALWAARAPRGFGLFEGVALERSEQVLPPMPKVEQLVMDYERVGLSLTDHPMCHLRASMNARGVVRAVKLQDLPHGTELGVAGVVLARQRPGTASGVVFVTLEDETGTMNLVIFSHVFERYRNVARHSTLLFARGKLERQITRPMPDQVGRPTPVVHIVVEHLERLDQTEAKPRVRSRDFH